MIGHDFNYMSDQWAESADGATAEAQVLAAKHGQDQIDFFLAVIMIKFICMSLPLDMFNCKLNGKIVFFSCPVICFKGY